jgi:hypothetical protein
MWYGMNGSKQIQRDKTCCAAHILWDGSIELILPSTAVLPSDGFAGKGPIYRVSLLFNIEHVYEGSSYLSRQ